MAKTVTRDRLSSSDRSALMSRVRARNTKPEQSVEALLRSLRYRFVRHVTALPGTPDFVLTRHRVVILVHGCFWHAHSCRRGKSIPRTRRSFWLGKKARNFMRDARVRRALRQR